MIIFENIELDLSNTLIAIVSSVIIYFAWKSTNVREDRLGTAVFIIENRRRLLDNIVRQPTNSAYLIRSSSAQSNNSNTTEEIEVEETERTSAETLEDLHIPEAPSFQAIIDEVNDLASSRNSEPDYRIAQETIENLNLDEIVDGDRLEIIEEMDNPDAEGLRRRRLEFYAGESSTSQTSANIINGQEQPERRENLNLPSQDSVDNSHAENCSNENNENENISKTDNKGSAGTAGDFQQQQKSDEVNSEFRIKLKYLNDDLRMVKGSPNEAIGDFKKRNFTVELAAQKLVRLVFNGHVLQPDSKTLQACGLFDNCVVHCLVHNKKPLTGEQDELRDQATHRQSEIGSNIFLDRINTGPFFIYFGVMLVCVAIGFCWFCRFQYSYLFSWYSTTGLILMTALFLLMFPLIILIERDVSSTATTTTTTTTTMTTARTET